MICIEKTHHAPPNSGQMILGRTLPSLLDEACDRAPNSQAFHQWTPTGWQSLSNQEFQIDVDAIALGLLDLGLEPGDRVALLMYSDVNFCVVDLACLLTRLVNVPIDLTQTLEQIIFVLKHSEAKVLVVSNVEMLAQIMPYLWDARDLKYILLADTPSNWQQIRSQWMIPGFGSAADAEGPSAPAEIPESIGLDLPMVLHPAHPNLPRSQMPPRIQVLPLEEVRVKGQGQRSEARHEQLCTAIAPEDLATIIYIPNALGQLEGVLLTHENLSANALASFSGLPDLDRGANERVLSFLPLNHVLARTLLYGHIHYGHSVYFSNPSRVMKHLREVKPTILVTVPIFLEKIYSKILDKGNKATSLVQRLIFRWALKLAQRYDLSHRPSGADRVLLKLADWLVLSQWRAVFGGQLKYIICGGAALAAEIVTAFAAAGVTILQGYGLTQASAVVTCNRGAFNRAGTVGVPIAGMEVAIAHDGEILVRGPCVTSGYYKNPEATQDALDPQGWLHTGDLGAVTDDGFLQITGLKKALFKLSTGKYIAPQPIEQRLTQSPLVEHAIAVGADRKFCAMLIVPNLNALHVQALENGIDLPIDLLLKHPCIVALYQAWVEAANCHLPYWATVKRFRLLQRPFTVANGLLTATGQVNRSKVLDVFADDIEALYAEDTPQQKPGSIPSRSVPEPDLAPSSQLAVSPVSCPPLPEASCPTVAQSLNLRINRLANLVFWMGLTLPISRLPIN